MVGALPTKNKIEKPHPHRVWLFYVLEPRRGEERGGEERFMSKIKLTFRGNFVGENQHYDY